MSEPQSTPKREVPKPIKASDIAAKAVSSPKEPSSKDRKDKRKGRQEQQEAQPRANPALMRGPRPAKPKAEPEPMVEEADAAELESTAVEPAEALASAELPDEAE